MEVAAAQPHRDPNPWEALQQLAKLRGSATAGKLARFKRAAIARKLVTPIAMF